MTATDRPDETVAGVGKTAVSGAAPLVGEPERPPQNAATPRAWEKQEAGWYTSDLGGICQEHDGWAFWPNNMEWPTLRRLPTMGAVIAEAERLARVRAAA